MSSRSLGLLIAFLDLVGVSIIMPVLPALTRTYRASALGMMAVVSVYPLMQGVLGPLLGPLSDKRGRLAVLLPTVVLAGVAYVGQAAASTYLMLFLCRALAGIASGNVPVAQASILDGQPESERTALLGQFGLVASLGFVAGNIVTASIAFIWGDDRAFKVCALLMAALEALSFLLLFQYRRLYEAHAIVFLQKKRLSALRGISKAAIPLILYLIVGLTFVLFTAITPLWLAASLGWRGMAIAGVYIGLAVAIGLAQALLAVRFEQRLGRPLTVTLSIALMAAGLAVGSLSQTVPATALLSALLLSVGYGIIVPTLLSAISASFPDEDRGRALGFAGAASCAAAVAGPLIGGALMDQGGASVALGFAACASTAGLLIAWFGLRSTPRTAAPVEIAT